MISPYCRNAKGTQYRYNYDYGRTFSARGQSEPLINMGGAVIPPGWNNTRAPISQSPPFSVLAPFIPLKTFCRGQKRGENRTVQRNAPFAVVVVVRVPLKCPFSDIGDKGG